MCVTGADLVSVVWGGGIYTCISKYINAVSCMYLHLYINIAKNNHDIGYEAGLNYDFQGQ